MLRESFLILFIFKQIGGVYRWSSEHFIDQIDYKIIFYHIHF
jgi:hypothetical protein